MASSETTKKIQTLQQQYLIMDEYLKIYKQRMIEINIAIDRLEKSKEKGETYAFQFLGANVMIKMAIDDIIQELKEEREAIANKIKTLERELLDVKNRLQELTKTIQLTGA